MARRRRRRRSFGSPPEEHRRRASYYSGAARKHFARAREFARTGDCALAIGSLTAGAYQLGAFRAERQGAGGRQGALGKIAISAKRRVIAACKVR